MQAASGFDVFTQSVTESLSLAALATFNTLTLEFIKIPSEMEVAPPHNSLNS